MRLINDIKGATATEFSFLVFFLSLGIITYLGVVGDDTKEEFQNVGLSMEEKFLPASGENVDKEDKDQIIPLY